MPGYGQLPALMRNLAEADLVFTGEQREWEGLYYAHDAVASGRAKGVIVLGTPCQRNREWRSARSG